MSSFPVSTGGNLKESDERDLVALDSSSFQFYLVFRLSSCLDVRNLRQWSPAPNNRPQDYRSKFMYSVCAREGPWRDLK